MKVTKSISHFSDFKHSGIHIVSALALVALTTFAACKKPEPVTPVVTDPNAKPEEVPVLKDGAGFSQKVSMLVNVPAGVNTSEGSLGIYDFSIDKSSQLHVLYFTGFQSQQDYLKTAKRGIYNWNTKQEVALPDPDKMMDNSSQQNYRTLVYQYLPYSGNVVAFSATEYRPGYYAQAFWGGYIPRTDMPMASSSTGAYTGGAGYYNVFTDLGTTTHYMTVNPNPASAVSLMYAHFPYSTPALSGTYLANFPEPRYSSQGSAVVVTVCKDSVVAYKITKYASATEAGAYLKTGQLTPSSLVATQDYTTLRHYNTDGTKMAMLLYGLTTKQYWTFTYDFSADVLAAGVSAVDLPYSAEGSDLDIDENGNIYYTGTAGNGSKTGVSIYKRSSSGTELVGTDDFLKFGEVVKLRYLNGKVHIAVQGKVTGRAPWSQLCFITQN